MSQEIKLDEQTKEKIKADLNIVGETINNNLTRLENIVADIQSLNINPEIFNIVEGGNEINYNKYIIKQNIEEFKNKMDLNMQELLELDGDLAKGYEIK